ncbi:hypothetical protein E1B28_011933 [Marasmius oreades]|uniref:Uncharacterized protein n=1 Tax=Marasmius oreades TaxID=181124 RepID=A0A9P7UPE0_9AGAR|nr:uncharacterized protein E1B28_011933 [Marasmius oreades]KAG7087886.1 hypothetical protein E1B28_011933 [Marasmius oreades]
MPLEEGNYFISYHTFPGDYPIARRLIDDGTYPKAVVKHAEPIPPEFAMWKVQPILKPNTFFLWNGDKPAACIDNLVWLKEEGPQVWVIEPGPSPGTYVILSDDKKFGWVVPDGTGDKDQVGCRDDAEPSWFHIVPADPQE